MKKYALFLPQFHEIPENNKWWGKGFTEWVNVRNAKSLFAGHVQPIHPLNDNYYDLTKKETVEWQTKLAKEYGIDGFVYYHYYSKGKLLLEKPAENLLKWTDINQKFFFCWANHDWRKTWKGTSEPLMIQEYGVEADWEQHFQYLLRFFKDDRYEKKDNMPLLILYKPFDVRNQMMEYFDQRCKEEGFAGLFLIEEYQGSNKKDGEERYWKTISTVTKKVFYTEPGVSTFILKYKHFRFLKKVKHYGLKWLKISHLEKYDANKLYREIENETFNDNIIHGLFFSWDNTPRHGKRGYIINEPSEQSVQRLMKKYKDEDMIIINAWNEWAEGMILEPTKENGYKYLEWIKQYS